MKYVALLSGGKDSCFNIIHCAQNGHKLIAAASLGPGEGKDELDSYMYQTVGQDAIHLVAEALDVPLYRRVITGSAVQQTTEYGSRSTSSAKGVIGDETEDLYELLLQVKNCHPDVQGVSAGAILSNYQRLRVEHVCLRLGLTPLCYLWQRDQRDLLDEMIQTSLTAVFIKVAGIGLTAQHLGRTLDDMRPTLHKLNHLYGSHICGEGGEYETLTLDSPLFKKRIVLIDTESVIHSDGGFASVAFLRIKRAILEDKAPASLDIIAPPLLSAEFQRVQAACSDASFKVDSGFTSLQAEDSVDKTVPFISDAGGLNENTVLVTRRGPWISLANIQAPGIFQTRTVDQEVKDCFLILQKHLARFDLNFTHISSVNLLLTSMDDFQSVNSVYKTLFGTSPPARACVSVELPPGIRIRLDCLSYVEDPQHVRQALHVQGLSYWAPANIGPYSQAVSVGNTVFISGQIGLIPASLTMPNPQSVPLETALSLQHLSRVKQSLQEMWSWHDNLQVQTTICWMTRRSDWWSVKNAISVLKQYNSAPLLFVGAKSLPKGALVEFQVSMQTGYYSILDEDQYESVLQDKGTFSSDTICSGDAHYQVFHLQKCQLFSVLITVRKRVSDVQAISAKLKELLKSRFQTVMSPISVRAFHKLGFEEEACIFLNNLLQPSQKVAVAYVPTEFIATLEDNGWDFGIQITGDLSSTTTTS